MGYIFMFFFPMPGDFLSAPGHCEFYTVETWIALYFFYQCWTFFWHDGK